MIGYQQFNHDLDVLNIKKTVGATDSILNPVTVNIEKVFVYSGIL